MDRIRLNLAITSETKAKIDKLKKMSKAKSTTETIRQALLLYEKMLTHQGKIVLQHDNGEEETVILLS